MKKARYILIIFLAILIPFFCWRSAVAEEIQTPESLEGSEEGEVEEKILPKLLIKAIFQSTSTEKYAGSYIEIVKTTDDDVLLDGIKLVYVNTSGNEKILFEFEDESKMVGEDGSTMLFRYGKVDDEFDKDSADGKFSTSLAATKGTIKIVWESDENEEKQEEVFDSVCWADTKKAREQNNCYLDFKSAAKDGLDTLVRENFELEFGDFEFKDDYSPDFDKENKKLVLKKVEDEEEEETEAEETHVAQCRGLEFSEIFTYFETNKTEQFVEFHNSADEQILLDGCFLKYKNKLHALSGIVLAGEYFAFYPSEFSFTKNPTSSNIVEIIDTDGAIVDKMTYFNGQKKGVSFAQFGYENGEENWLQTYDPTPGEANNYQKWKTCPAGKVINEETGNCVKETTLDTTLEACPAGKYRNPLTNRCKSYATTTSSELKPCADGYERNPETNRCRKIKTNTGAEYELSADTVEEKSTFIAIWSIVAVGAIGVGYVVFQYRQEIGKIFRRKK